MTDINIKLQQLDITNASDNATLIYSSANNTLEYRLLANSAEGLDTAINTVQDNVDALTSTAAANDYSTYTTVTGLINTVQANVDALPDSAANDYSTYTTLSGLIDTVQDNVSSQTSNTQAYVANTLVSNTALIFEAGDGISLSANSTSKTISFAVSMGNVTSQVISLDGSANSFTINQSAANSNMLLVFYNGLAQDPTEYSVDGTTLTLNNVDPIISSSKLEIRHFDFFDVPGISSGGGGGGSSFQGTVSGYTSGGTDAPGYTNVIDKFPFSSDSNASDVGDLTAAQIGAGQSSSTHGYFSGGQGTGTYNKIEKFSFLADGNASDVGDLTGNFLDGFAGHSSSVSGYVSGGGGGPGLRNTIEKFPFSTDSNATDVGDLTQARQTTTGQSSPTNGYTSGGDTGSYSNVIDKFPFATDANASDVGDLTQARRLLAGQNSSENGYTSGGRNPAISTALNTIDKFPFATDSNATDVGDLTVSRFGPAGQSSSESGYNSGGYSAPPFISRNIIDKFPFSSDANATDVGDLTQARRSVAGQQV